MTTTLDRIRRWVASLRRFDDEVTELYERRALLDRPWEEKFLHWAFDGEHWHLHGSLPPPADDGRGRRRSVTKSGWCPGLARQRRSSSGRS